MALTIPRRLPPAAAGFVLPLALTASAVLLLGSASIHTLSLQGRLRVHAAAQRDQGADQLRSAAQAFATAANGAQACLLPWPLAHWHAGMAGCPDADPNRLRSGQLGELGWRVIGWQPSGDTGRLQLALADGRRASFRISLDTGGPAVLAISEAQLQGRVSQQEAP